MVQDKGGAQDEAVSRQEVVLHAHIGNLIKEELERQRRSARWLADEICCDRTNIYNIFKRSTIDTELLAPISEALGVDFFAKLSEGLRMGSERSATDC